MNFTIKNIRKLQFIASLNKLKNEQLENTRTQIQNSASVVVDTLINVMQNSKNDNARINAAKEVLSISGLSKDSLTMYGWGIGADTPEQVKADKLENQETEKLLSALSNSFTL